MNETEFLREWKTVEKSVISVLSRNRAPNADIDDLVQETKIRCWKAFKTRGDGSFKTWVLRIACRLHIDLTRKHHYSKEKSYDALEDPQNMPFLRHEPKTLEEILPRWLDQMPEIYRDALLCEIQGLSDREAGEVCDCTESGARTRLHRARQWAKERIALEKKLDIERGNLTG